MRYADTIFGGAGNDWVDYNQSFSGVTVDLEAGVTTLNGPRPVVVTHLNGIENAIGTSFNDVLIGNAGNNILDGNLGLDIASYAHAESGVDIDLENGIVEGDDTGTDTLRRIEGAEGSEYDDTYDARGFGSTSLNSGSYGTYNVFEGRGGDDEIWGNGNTLVSYEHATGGVEVDLDDGEVEGNASVGEDELHNVNAVQGSAFNDTFKASDDADTFVFKGQFGNDTIEDFEAGNGGTTTCSCSPTPRSTASRTCCCMPPRTTTTSRSLSPATARSPWRTSACTTSRRRTSTSPDATGGMAADHGSDMVARRRAISAALLFRGRIAERTDMALKFRVELVWEDEKDRASSIYLTGDGRVILQGRAVSAAERETLSLPSEGDMISVDRNLIRAIKEML